VAAKKNKQARAAASGAPEDGAARPETFERSIARLGEIVDELEGGELPLEESLRRFEEGVGIARRARTLLDDAERRVERLLGVDDEGRPLVEDLDEGPEP